MPTSSSSVRRAVRMFCAMVLAALAGGLLSLGMAAPAAAEEGFRYWNYFHLQDGEWAFATTGPAGYTPKDGAVEGYRFASSPASDTDGVPPRADLAEVNFDTICGGVEAGANQKRVAVVIDYGTEADADGATPPQPRAECAVVPADASGMRVLQAVADVRIENDFSCALDGYPATGCAEPVPQAQVTGEEEPVPFQIEGAAEQATEGDEAGQAGDPGETTEAGEGTQGAGDAAVTEGAEDDGFPWAVVVIGAIAAAVALGTVILAKRDRSA